MITPIEPNDDNRLQLSPDFMSLFPGPYFYCPGNDGVDSTFDVMCIASGEHIASVYYWEERLTSELIARVISESLNALLPIARADSLSESKPLSQWEVAAFRGMHAGPYRASAMHCGYRGHGYEVLCDATSESLLQIFRRGESECPRLITSEIATALNALNPRD